MYIYYLEGLKSMAKKELPVFSVILFIVGALTAAFAVAAGYGVIITLADGLADGSLAIEGNILNIVSYCVWEFGIYVIFTFILLGLAVSIQHSATAASLLQASLDRERDRSKEPGAISRPDSLGEYHEILDDSENPKHQPDNNNI